MLSFDLFDLKLVFLDTRFCLFSMVKLASSFDVFTLKPGDIVSAKSLSTASSLSCTVVVVGSKIDIEFVTITLQIQWSQHKISQALKNGVLVEFKC